MKFIMKSSCDTIKAHDSNIFQDWYSAMVNTSIQTEFIMAVVSMLGNISDQCLPFSASDEFSYYSQTWVFLVVQYIRNLC